MSSAQIEKTKIFGHILVTDTKAKTNRFGMYLMVFVGLDHNGKMFLASCALINDETADTFNWVLNQLQLAVPEWAEMDSVIFSDNDLALEAAIRESCPSATHFLCRWHMYQDINSNLRSILAHQYDDFLKM